MNLKEELTDNQLYTLKILRTPSAGRTLARWLMGLSGVFFIMLFVPWQQNIRGTGKITAFTPGNRPQTIESAIPGRIASWHIREGQYVNKGDTIVTLSEIKDKFFDPNLLTRLSEQVKAKENSIESKKSKTEALRMQIRALRNGLDVKYKQAQNKLKQTELKLVSDSVDYEAEQIRFRNFESQYARNKTLFEAGNIALTKYQDIESKYQESKMKVVSSENKFLQTKAELINAQINLAGVQAEYQDKISKSESELNATLASLYDSEADLAKTRNEFANMEIRNDQYQLIAPQSGYVVKAIKAGIGQTIKEGEAVVTIMPENPDMAVEMYVKAMDVPLLSKGRKVRVEFDGWPALQVSGWPSVSVGTFGGEVKVIDYVNSRAGEFRILVTPDPDDEPWPSLLRVGSGTKGWVMLDDVPIWYEIWRNLNGFPPSLYEEPLDLDSQKAKEEAEKKDKK
ncbi:MAG: HlyD family efflux transporter periplasmic adaptor subunit [Fulvivirga sp.]|uniref:HlyD family secretion protein n=1 Tax=Fulvivirga sp. TaxID=1931237 RepID=UPI0032EE9A60